MELSNKMLATVVVASIIISLASTVSLLNRLSSFQMVPPPTGRAPTDVGLVNFTVSNEVSILLNRAIIDFGSGSVNISCDYVSAYDYANITALNHTFIDSTDCWTGSPAAPGNGKAFLVENNGNLNASVSVRGSDNATFFNSFASSYPYGIQIRGALSEGEGQACPVGQLQTEWQDLSANATICGRLNYDPSTDDEIAVEVNVKIPRDIPSGEYNSSVVEFYAIQAT